MKTHIIVANDYLNNEMIHYVSQEDNKNPTAMHHIRWMLEQIIMNNMSDTKANRWLGYVQGIMTMHNMIDVNNERNRTRDIFNGE